MSATKKMISGLLSETTKTRLLSELALKDLFLNSPIDLFTSLATFITTSSDLSDLSCMILNKFITQDKLLDYISKDLIQELEFLCLKSLSFKNSSHCSQILLSSLVHHDLTIENFDFFIEILNFPIAGLSELINVIRTLGLICEKKPKIDRKTTEKIFDCITSGILIKDAKIIALQALRRGLSIFYETIHFGTIGNILYKAYQDESIDTRLETLETICEYTEIYKNMNVFVDYSIIHYVLMNDCMDSKQLALEILNILKDKNISYEIIETVIKLIENSEFFDGCVDVLSYFAIFSEEILIKFITFQTNSLYTSISLIGCLSKDSKYITTYFPYTFHYLSTENPQIQEISA